jgi:hypothetical protein
VFAVTVSLSDWFEEEGAAGADGIAVIGLTTSGPSDG